MVKNLFVGVRASALLLLVSLLFGLGACQSKPKFEPAWQDAEIEVPSARLLWEVAVFALEKEGFPVGSEMDPTTLTAISGWRYSLAPFRGQGRRQRAEILFTSVGPRRYGVRVRVQQDVNMDIVRPMDLSYAEWEEAPDSPEAALILMQRIRSWVGPTLELKSLDAPKAPGT